MDKTYLYHVLTSIQEASILQDAYFRLANIFQVQLQQQPLKMKYPDLQMDVLFQANNYIDAVLIPGYVVFQLNSSSKIYILLN